jgi:hypothetical protein
MRVRVTPDEIDEAVRQARNWPDEPVHVYAGTTGADSRGDWGIAQAGRRTVTRADRPWFCPPGHPYLCLATVTAIDDAIIVHLY